MTQTATLLALEQILPESAWGWAIPALRYDPVIWQALQNPDFRGLAIQKLGSQPESWLPASLAMLKLAPEMPLEEIRATPLAKLEIPLRQRAIHAFEQQTGAAPAPIDLELAGLLALVLRERMRLSDSWPGLVAELRRTADCICSWQTALTCTYSLLLQPEELLNDLPAKTAVSILLAIPCPAEQLHRRFAELLQKACDSVQVEILQTLAEQHPLLAQALAQSALGAEPDSRARNHALAGAVPNAAPKLLAELQQVLIHTRASQIAADLPSALPLLQTAGQLSQRLHSHLVSQAAQAAAYAGDPITALATWQQISHGEPADGAALALALIDQGALTSAQTLIEALPAPTESDQPDFLVSLARGRFLLATGQQSLARAAAQQACQSSAAKPIKISSTGFMQLIALLKDCALPRLAAQAADRAVRIYRTLPSVASLAAKIFTINGKFDAACEAAHFAVAADPQNLSHRRVLADCLESAGSWQEAMQQRQQILERQTTPSAAEKLAYARCALHCGQPLTCLEICSQRQAEEPEDSQALTLMGQALLALDETPKAQHYLQKATRAAPDHAAAWLLLAHSQMQAGQLDQALETLAQGSQANPEDASIFLALGEAHLVNNALTQALTAFQKSDELAQAFIPALRARIALPFGQVAFTLGHHEQAFEIAASALAEDPLNLELGKLHARLLIALDRVEAAIEALSKLLEAHPQDVELCLEYARAHLREQGSAVEAALTLERLLQIEPQHAEAQGLLAEAYAASGDNAAALQAYRVALNSDLRESPAWFVRLSLGLGRAALAQNQPETALAALSQALPVEPHNIAVLQALALGYRATNLTEKALKIAQSAFDLAPTDLGTTLWFVDLATDLGAQSVAIEALETAVGHFANPSRLYLRLGALHQAAGNQEAAQQAFRQAANEPAANADEIHQASAGLLACQDFNSAITALQHALDLVQQAPYVSDQQPDRQTAALLADLARAYEFAGERSRAMEMLDRAINISPDRTELHGQKAKLLWLEGALEQAHAAIDRAIVLSPEEGGVLGLAAQIARAEGQIAVAFDYAQKALQVFTEQGTSAPLSIEALAVDLAEALLLPVTACGLLQDHPTPLAGADSLPYFCLRAELALDDGSEIEAATALTQAQVTQVEHPRLMALQARLAARQGDIERGSQSLEQAIEQLGSEAVQCDLPAGMWIAMAEAAIEYRQWASAIYLLQKAVEFAPAEPRTHLRLARALALRAEAQRLCQTLNIEQHAPGAASLGEHAYQRFEAAILAACEACSEPPPHNPDDPQKVVSMWLLRGQAAFHPSPEQAHAFGSLARTADQLAAYLAALRSSGARAAAAQKAQEIFETYADQWPAQPALAAQLALALAREAPSLALRAAQSAADGSIRLHLVDSALYQAVLAFAAQRAGKPRQHLAALQTALGLWPDEPRWHALTGELLLNQNEPQSIEIAIDHFKQATQLEPKEERHFLRLGQAYLLARKPQHAIPAFESAARLAPDKSDPWIGLTQAYRALGDNERANACAGQAVQINPQEEQAYLLLAKIASETGDPQSADEYSTAALKINPTEPQALLLHARSLAELDQHTQALEAFEQALPHLPATIPLLLEHSQFIRNARGSAAALARLQILADEYPEEPALLTALCEALIELEKIQPAIQAAQKALLHAHGTLSTEQIGQLWITLGRLLRRAGQLDQAIHALSQAIETLSESVDAYLELARVYHERRQYDQALEIYNQAIHIAPGDYRPYYQVGLILKTAKDYSNAETMFRRASRLAPENLHIHRQLGAMVALNLVHNRANPAPISG